MLYDVVVFSDSSEGSVPDTIERFLLKSMTMRVYFVTLLLIAIPPHGTHEKLGPKFTAKKSFGY